jgi:large subunit ribosomal protein L16
MKFKQIEACRRTIKRGLNKLGKLWIKIFTNVQVSKKALASRMGKGKGNLSHWIALIKKGQILFEISGVNKETAFLILKKSKSKLPIKTKIAKIIY